MLGRFDRSVRESLVPQFFHPVEDPFDATRVAESHLVIDKATGKDGCVQLAPQPGQVHQAGPVRPGRRLEPRRDQRICVRDAQ